MIKAMDELEALYAAYSQALARSKQEKANLQTYFSGMLRSGLGSDGFSGQFAEDVKLCIERFADTKPQSREALEVMHFVLKNGQNAPHSVISMQEAVQGYLLPLTPLLDAADAQELLSEYYDKRAVKRLLPVQKKLMLAIRKQSEVYTR